MGLSTKSKLPMLYLSIEHGLTVRDCLRAPADLGLVLSASSAAVLPPIPCLRN
jgi:hypothetical protein